MSSNTRYLDDDEVESFLNELDKNKNSFIEYDEVEQGLDRVHEEIQPDAKPHNLHHDSKDEARHHFLRTIIGSKAQRIPRAEFASRVREWKVPSMKQESEDEKHEEDLLKSMSIWRRFRSYWAVRGPDILFVALVISMQLAFGLWQLVKYVTGTQYTAAFGWGVVLAKTCAGALYPTMFFLLLSMSRYFSTFMRRSTRISRIINFDLSQKFHIRISIVALCLATLHAIGHLSGSFNWGSRPENQADVAALLGPDMVPRPYVEYVRSLPGWSGIVTLGLLYSLSILSIPQVRKWNYEVFQLGHLLMYPIIGLLCAHGTMALLQWPMLGYFLAFPTLLILVERVVRVAIGFHKIPATISILDDQTLEIKATIPSERLWKYQAGQYVFLQVPKVSFFQWHPFTVSACVEREMWLHIKVEGSWTKKLKALGGDNGTRQIDIGINGPFGAPAQRFYDFDHTMIVGAGIGVTPFSGILMDLQTRDNQLHGGPDTLSGLKTGPGDRRLSVAPTQYRVQSQAESQVSNSRTLLDSVDGDHSPPASKQFQKESASGSSSDDPYRRVDFHWMVRERNQLLWFSDLLNTVSRSQIWHHQNDDDCHLTININTHVTQKRKNIATHVYRWLLEMHRIKDHPASPLTGLINPTHFGRPDFEQILNSHYEDMKKMRTRNKEMPGQDSSGRLKVGVFFCGTPVIGEILADQCRMLSARGRTDGTKIEYHFMIEVFG
ncbi:FAD-binding domain-containing protein [Truncatella angustata]|uniref:FAD-binding domain-containing protein n=1 Tax=Truncatella angustata TaxID=152316 RepID=A0A9P8UHU1_9PEZI|nr:FAD-binding domain-containing protein [Truncatella angustata]KAH6652628.1 FAD-binding domain-containing protein [Truncatella angustata]